MRKLIVSEFVSLDGVIQAPGGKDEDTDGGFKYGGWTWPYWHDDIGASFFAMMRDMDAFLLGRRTYVTPRCSRKILSTSCTCSCIPSLSGAESVCCQMAFMRRSR
jgi:hypothetical protein